MKRIRKKFVFLLFLFALVPFPKSFHPPESARDHEWFLVNGANFGVVDAQKELELSHKFFCPQTIVYAAFFLILLMVTLLLTLDLFFKTVFIVCSFGVHWATYCCRLQTNTAKSKVILQMV